MYSHGQKWWKGNGCNFTTVIISRFLAMTVYEEVRLEVNASKIALQQKDWRALQSIKKVA